MNANEALKSLSSRINSIPKHPGDLNIICTIVYGQYQAKKAIVGALELPIIAITRSLEGAINIVNDEVYNTIIKNISALNAQMKKVIPVTEGIFQIEKDILNVGNLLSQTCTDFLNSLPESLFNMFQNLNYNLFDPAIDILNLPVDLAQAITGEILSIKDQALQAVLGTLYDTLLIPFFEYEEFIKSNGVLELIRDMKSMETCMMKPGICHRPRAGFVHKESNKLWSQYYLDSFLMDARGNLNLAKLISDPRKQSQIHNMFKRIHNFMG